MNFILVCECKMYDVIRKSLLPKYYWKSTNMFKFIELIKSDSKDIINKLGWCKKLLRYDLRLCIIIKKDISIHII